MLNENVISGIVMQNVSLLFTGAASPNPFHIAASSTWGGTYMGWAW